MTETTVIKLRDAFLYGFSYTVVLHILDAVFKQSKTPSHKFNCGCQTSRL
ncbi:hypothetical protein GCM10020370_15160 [Paenibacillus hodogayensis]